MIENPEIEQNVSVVDPIPNNNLDMGHVQEKVHHRHHKKKKKIETPLVATERVNHPPRVIVRDNYDSRKKRTVAVVGTRPPEETQVDLFVNIIDIGTGSFCTNWWSTRPFKIRPNQVIKFNQADMFDLKDKKAQLMYWSYEYICLTSNCIVSGPSGVDFCSAEGSRTIYWRPQRCSCRNCALVKPFDKKAPGAVLNFDEQVIPCGDVPPKI